ncbi:MAG: hypothetical protein ACJA0V_004214 [Planctomycetota bacterium]|jgi:hypothetical protein
MDFASLSRCEAMDLRVALARFGQRQGWPAEQSQCLLRASSSDATSSSIMLTETIFQLAQAANSAPAQLRCSNTESRQEGSRGR